MSRYSKVTLTTLLLTLVFLIGYQPAIAEVQRTTNNYEVPFDFYSTPTDTPCLTETVHVVGTVFNWMTSMSIPSGRTLFSWKQTAKLTGVGLTTGDTYQMPGPFIWTGNYDTDTLQPVEFTIHNMITFIGPGQDGKFLVTTLTHFTYDQVTGDVKVEVEKENAHCQ